MCSEVYYFNVPFLSNGAGEPAGAGFECRDLVGGKIHRIQLLLMSQLYVPQTYTPLADIYSHFLLKSSRKQQLLTDATCPRNGLEAFMVPQAVRG
jgi:hypothetical protein